MPPQNNPQDFDLFTEIMTQLREINRKVDNQATKDDLKNFVLQAVFDVTIANLKKTDEDQQKHLDELELRQLSTGQRYFTYFCGVIGIIGGVISILTHFH